MKVQIDLFYLSLGRHIINKTKLCRHQYLDCCVSLSKQILFFLKRTINILSICLRRH